MLVNVCQSVRRVRCSPDIPAPSSACLLTWHDVWQQELPSCHLAALRDGCHHHYCTALDGAVPQQPEPAPCRFVFCRQRQDERLRRGGEQKSLVVLSEIPFSSVLGMLAQYAGPLYFNRGPVALQEASIQLQGSLHVVHGYLVLEPCLAGEQEH